MPNLLKSQSDHSIESIPYFSAIAWTIFILFAAFVFLLTRQLHETTVALEARTWAEAGFVAEASTTDNLLEQTKESEEPQ